jgi:hypothetical protein
MDQKCKSALQHNTVRVRSTSNHSPPLQVRYSTQPVLNNARTTRPPAHHKREAKLTRPAPKSESERTYQQLYHQLTEAQRSADTARTEHIFHTMRDSPHLNYALFNSMVRSTPDH